MKVQPLTQWQCTRCRQPVTADEGYVTWDDDLKGPRNFKIVHQGRCDDGAQHSSAALGDFLGPDGLAYLTSMLSYGPALPNQGTPTPPDLEEFTDFLRRVQIPYYEEARQRFGEQEVQDDLQGTNQVAPYLQRYLQQLAKKA